MGMSISKMAQLDTLGLSESTIKRKRRQLKLTGLIYASRDLVEKRSSTKKRSVFILEHLAGNPFFKRHKDCYIPEGTVQGFLRFAK